MNHWPLVLAEMLAKHFLAPSSMQLTVTGHEWGFPAEDLFLSFGKKVGEKIQP